MDEGGRRRGLLLVQLALGGLASPTRETTENAVRDLLPSSSSDATALVPFTGYYGITTLPGTPSPFLSINTSVVYIYFTLGESAIGLGLPFVTIAVSTDGIHSQSYTPSAFSFNGTTLSIPGAQLNVNLTRGYQMGPLGEQLVALSGTIGSIAVSGATYFNPVELGVFTGSYLSGTPQQTVLEVTSSSLRFDSGHGLANVPIFFYDPAMYVVRFLRGDVEYELMLGTANQYGMACFITGAQGDDGLALTIPSVANTQGE